MLCWKNVPLMKELSREEALARLATLYFQSHSPATLSDFVWWSGLAATEGSTCGCVDRNRSANRKV